MKHSMKSLYFILLFCMTRGYGQAPEIEWQKTIGGSGYDWLKCSQITFDGGIILAGNSSSGISGDKTEDTIGGWDVWVIKLDSNYNIEWQNTIGGDQGEGIEGLQQTIDGGYILGCISNSDISGDKTENHLGGADSLGNYYDYWVVKLDPEGNICLLYTSDAADERSSVDLGGPRIIKKKNNDSSQHRTHTKK